MARPLESHVREQRPPSLPSRLVPAVVAFVATSWQYCVLLSASIRQHVAGFCVVTDDINLDHLLKVVSARFLLYEFNFSSFITNKCLGRRYFQTTQIPCFFLYFQPLILGFIDNFCPPPQQKKFYHYGYQMVIL